MKDDKHLGCSAGNLATPGGRDNDIKVSQMQDRQTQVGDAKFRECRMQLPNCAHLGSFHRTDSQHQAMLRAFAIQGLKQNEKVIVIFDEDLGGSALSIAELTGRELQPLGKSGQLRILPSSQTFLQHGMFDPLRVISWLRRESRKAQAEGYRALRVAAEMAWALRGAQGTEKLIDYEAEIDALLRGHRCRMLCQYDARRFPPAVLQHVLTTHPTVVVEDAVCPNSYYRLAPSNFGNGPASTTLGQWLADLSAHSLAVIS